MGGDNYRKDHRRQYVIYLELEAGKLPKWRPVGHRLWTSSESALKGLELAQALDKRNWVPNRKLGISGVVDQEWSNFLFLWVWEMVSGDTEWHKALLRRRN